MPARLRGSPDSGARVAIDRGWEVAAAPAGAITDPAGLAGLTWLAATVPGTAAGALRAAGAWGWDDPRKLDAEDFWWRVTLDPELVAPGAAIVLGLDGVATLWDAWQDGERIGAGDNMFRGHELDLLPGARQLVIRCRALDAELAKKRPRPRWRVPMLEQQQLRWIRTTLLGRTPGWSPRCPAIGPWRPVWLERRARPLPELALDVRVEAGVGFATCSGSLGFDADACELVVRRGGDRVARGLEQTGATWHGSVAIEAPELWWPHTHGSPERYHVSLEARRGSETVAIPLGERGFRTVEFARGDGRELALRVNGVPVFCRGACWTPLDPVTLSASREAYAGAVAQLRSAGMNMIRIGGTMVYEADALYDELDAQGVLLWQDLMFANMDYPDDPAFVSAIELEVDQQLARLAARPSLAVICGNSEGEQQAAMWGAVRELWTPRLFHEVLARAANVRCSDVPYVPSSATGGAFPHASNAGPTSYYGVGAYLRGIDDARRAEVRFASECLAFANVPADATLPRVHDPRWKARTPRDLGAGWDFDDVRDHYVQRLFGVDPGQLRWTDHDRYLALGRVATGEVMAQTFGEWRRARSTCRGGLIWFLRDLVPGAGWGVIDAHGVPKPCWYLLRRALAPVALAITDEGTNGLAIHAVNDRPTPLAARLELALWRGGEISVGRGHTAVEVPAHGAIELAAATLFEGWLDLSGAHRFGRPVADVVHASLAVDGATLAETFWFPGGWSAARELDVGLAVSGTPGALEIRSRRFAQAVAIEAPGFQPSDNYFHLAPGQARTIALAGSGKLRATITALNAEVGARFEATA